MRLPYNRKRAYLSGIDWIIATIDFYMQKTSTAGNHSSLILELKNSLSSEKLYERLLNIYSYMPLLSGTIKRDLLNLAPYWKTYPSKKNSISISSISGIDSDKQFHHLLQNILNSNFLTPQEHLKFNLITGKNGNYLVMTFDHKLFDAKGAELFLNLLSDMPLKELNELLYKIKITNAPKLINWNEKFNAGKQIQRYMIKMSENECFSPADTNMNEILKETKNRILNFKIKSYSLNDTSKILKNGEKTAGFMMETNFFLSAVASAVYSTFAANKDILLNIPMPADYRSKSEHPTYQLLRNHLSFMFLNIQINKNDSLKSLSEKFKKSVFEQVSLELPEQLIKASRLARICPLQLLYKFMKLSMNGKICSYAFANVGKSTNIPDILGSKIINISHLPRVPTPPGIGFFFNIFSEKLHFSVTWDSNKFEKNTVDGILNKIDYNLKQE